MVVSLAAAAPFPAARATVTVDCTQRIQLGVGVQTAQVLDLQLDYFLTASTTAALGPLLVS